MTLNRLVALSVFVAVLILAPWMWASGAEMAGHERGASTTSLASAHVKAAAGSNMNLETRAPLRKRTASELRLEPGFKPIFVVKFKDAVRARPAAGRADMVVSRSGADVSSFQGIVDRYRLTVHSHFSHSEQRLSEIQFRAEQMSSRAQPDLAGFLRVTGPANVIERAALEINALDIVEFVEFTDMVDVDLSELDAGPRQQQNAQFNAPWRQVHAREQAKIAQENIWDGKVVPKADHGHHRPRPAKLPTTAVPMDINTGLLTATGLGNEPEVVFDRIFDIPDVPWIRLFFRDVQLGGSKLEGNASYLVVTSLVTGESQVLDAHRLQQWSNATAFFRGGQILLQLYAYPGNGVNRVVIDRAEVGEWAGGVALTICDTEDMRQQSADPAVGRLMGGGGICSSFLFNDNERCMLSASHCDTVIAAGGATVHFNVPDSMPDGTPVPSAIVDQFPVLIDSAMFEPLPCGVNCSEDWSIFGVGDNVADQSPLQWQGVSHTLAPSLPPADGRDVTVRGYGTTLTTDAPDSWSNTQTEHTGPLVQVAGTELRFRADATPGSSGGPVIDATTGLVIGVVTCSGCLPFGAGSNIGTGINHPNLVHAFSNPDFCSQGVQGFTGACCVSGTCFDNITPADCAANAGIFRGVGSSCPVGPLFENACDTTYLCCSPFCSEATYWECNSACFDCQEDGLTPSCILHIYGIEDYECDPEDPEVPCFEDPGCGSPTAGHCFTPRTSTHCNDEGLCEQVCAIDPFCCDPDLFFPLRGFGHWDAICVWHARRLSGQDVHPCFDSSGDCLSQNATPGCNDPGCCLAVCQASPACCGGMYNWDSHCAQLALEICGDLNPDGPTPDLSENQGYLTPQSYFAEYGRFPAGVAASIGLDGPFGYAFDFKSSQLPLLGWSGEGYDLQGLWDFGELIEGENLTRGKTIRVGVLYPTAFVDPFDDSKTHEDLRGRVTYPEVDQTMIFNPGSPSGLLDGHVGTAVLGVIGANPDNGGMRGMAPDADLYFFPTVSHEEGGRFQNAFMSALVEFDPGDVLVLPYSPRLAGATFATSQLGWTMLAIAADLGITCVIAAGDTNVPVDEQWGGPGDEPVDANVIVVGAVTPGWPYYRLGFSNHCTDSPCPDLEAVNISGWGAAVAAPGFGDLYLGRTDGQPDLMRSYTASFGGTAASSAQIGAVAAMLQGLAKQFWDIPLAPAQIRGEMCLTGFCQGTFCLGSEPPGESTAEGVPGFFGDWDLGVPGGWVGSIVYSPPQFPDLPLSAHIVFPDLAAIAEWIVAEGYFDDCHIEEIHTVRGDYDYGNTWSACALDQNYYVARSMNTGPNSGPSNKVPAYDRELSKIVYSATGQVADVLAVARPEWDVVTSLSVTAVGNLSEGRQHIAFIELFDWNIREWVLGGISVGVGGLAVETFPFVGSTPYVRPDDKTVLVRVWAYGFPLPEGFGDGPSDPAFDLRIDLIDIQIGGYLDHQ